jgi:hypothetical protein
LQKCGKWVAAELAENFAKIAEDAGIEQKESLIMQKANVATRSSVELWV